MNFIAACFCNFISAVQKKNHFTAHDSQVILAPCLTNSGLTQVLQLIVDMSYARKNRSLFNILVAIFTLGAYTQRGSKYRLYLFYFFHIDFTLTNLSYSCEPRIIRLPWECIIINMKIST